MTNFEKVLERMRELHRIKQADYVGDNPDTLAAFRASSELLGLPVSQIILGRCMDKVSRAAKLLKRGDLKSNVHDESIRDTAIDLAVYSVILVEAIDELLNTIQKNDKIDDRSGRIQTIKIQRD